MRTVIGLGFALSLAACNEYSGFDAAEVGASGAAEQMTNFARVTELAGKMRVPCWVSTSQPRKFAEVSRRQLLLGTRDAINAKYGEYALDFWTQFANADGTTKAEYDAGDGIHMNDAAHALLVEQVIAAHVPEAVLAGP